MKDIHNHILFGIDDGSKSIEESINIIKQAVKNGYTDLILTPHYRAFQNYTCNNKKKEKLFAVLKGEIEKENIKVNLYLGNEIFVDEDFLYHLKTNQITSLNSSRYLLLELPFTEKCKNLKEVIEILKKYKCIPVIAHPERYSAYSIKDYEELLNDGVLFQGNMSSLFGKYGLRAKDILEEMLRKRMIHFIGSDVHHEGRTSYDRINDVVARLEELTGSYDIALDLVDRNIEAVIKDQLVVPYPVRTVNRKFKFLKKLGLK